MAENVEVIKKDGEEGGSPPAAPDPMAAVKEIVADFRASLADVTNKVATAVAPQPSNPNAAAYAEYEARKKRVDELAAEGKAAESYEEFVGAITDLQRKTGGAQQPDMSTHPIYKSQFETIKREVKRDNQDVMKRWGGEVEAFISRLTPEERINPTKWEEAIAYTRASHLDEILAGERTRIEEDAKARWSGPTAPGSRGNVGRGGGGAGTLTHEEAGIVDSLGLTAEEYTSAKKFLDETPPDKGGHGWDLGLDKIPKPGRF